MRRSTGFRDDRFHDWLVRFGEDGSERRMTEPEFQDLVRTVSPDREIAAVQQVGAVIYVQHISDGTLKSRRHRTEMFHIGSGA